MSGSIPIAVVVGSLRKDSYSRRIAEALIDAAPDELACRMVGIADLPMYNQDLDDDPPAAWTRFRKEISACRAVLFVTPEYNRSIPGCLKNAVDVGSRPQGSSVFDGIPAGVVSVTPYKLGAFGANHALRQTFVFLNMRVMQQPEAYIGGVADLLDDAGKVSSAETSKFLHDFMRAFAAWVNLAATGPAGDFDAFMQDREAASVDYINGQPDSLHPMLASSDPATFFPPRGETAVGADAVRESYDAGARAFDQGGRGSFEVLQCAAGGELAFWAGYQRAHVHLHGKEGTTEMTLRTTEVFRNEEGQWKLIHRHADMGGAR